MHLLISLTSGISAAAVISSEQLDSWGELGAVAILGLVCIGFGFLHWQDSKLHAKSVDRLANAQVESANVIGNELREYNETNRQLIGHLLEHVNE